MDIGHNSSRKTPLLGLLFASIFLTLGSVSAENHERPKIGIVLAGGGALGIAHVGVLKVLEENRIPVHVVTGTSMGALVGAAVASGVPIDEMEEVLLETDWEHLFNEIPPRANLDYRLKPGRDRELYGRTRIAVGDVKANGGAGFLEGQHVLPLLQRLYRRVPNPTDFSALPLPFRAIAADIETGEEVVIKSGSLAKAARASMSVPGAFTPVIIDGKLLVDGGIVNNLPVDQAIALGADVIIVVELYADLKKRDDLASPLEITGQMFSLLISQNSSRQAALMRKQDVMIAPDIKGFTTTDFTEGEELIARGEAAANAALPKIKHLAVSPEEYAKYQQGREIRGLEETIDFIEIDNGTGIPHEVILHALGLEVGEPLDREAVERGVRAVYDTGHFSTVEYEFTKKKGRTGITLKTEPQPWKNDFVRVGFALEDDFQGNAFYSVGLNYRTSELNAYGAYLDLKGEIGRDPNVELEFFQPLGRGNRFFVAPLARLGRSDILIRDGDDTIAEYERTEYVSGISFGRAIPSTGEVRVGIARGLGKFDLDIGDPALPDFDYDVGEASGEFVIDTLDTPDFPTSGHLLDVNYTHSLRDLGATDTFNQLVGTVMAPVSFGRNTIIPSSNFAQTFDDRPVERSFSLGGFFSVPGYERSSLFASDYFQGRLAYFRRFSESASPFLSFAFFAGGTIEYTFLQTDVAELGDPGGIISGSTFIGADTPIVPLYLGFGMAEEGNVSGYILLGRVNAGSR